MEVFVMEVILFIVLGSVLGRCLFDLMKYVSQYVSEISKISYLNSSAISNYINFTNKFNQEFIIQIVANLDKTGWFYHIKVLGIGALVLLIVYAIYTIYLCISKFCTIYENPTNHPEQQTSDE